jgi:type III restriction enzyme
MTFKLFEFQEEAAAQLSGAIADWSQAAGQRGAPTDPDGTPIPLFGHLTAITGAGKTPILAKVMGGVGPAIIIWTTSRSVVIDQTVQKLRTSYRHFLPPDTTVIGERPTPSEWTAMMEGGSGLFIWCLTVASWNDTDAGTKGTGEARLSIHRPAPDWAGESSPWEQLSGNVTRTRPLWVVYDEGHGQTDVQLDQLLELNPVGIIAASGTPSFSDKITKLRGLIADHGTWGPMVAKAMVEVPTQKVAEAGLLKAGIEMVDLNTDNETKIIAAVDQLKLIEEQAANFGISVKPRAIYVTEESDRSSGEPRPVTIWKILTERCGVDPSEIAVATSTRELPKEAERVSDLAQLRPRHRHLIFNKKFQEGWDDPEAYVAYFDGETKSVTRIKQIIGRVIRQPNARHFEGIPDLNTAFLFMSSPDEKFRAIVEGIRKHLVEEYGSDEAGEPNIKLQRRSERPPITPIRPEAPALELPVLVLQANDLDSLEKEISAAGARPFPEEQLEAPGTIVKLRFDLTELQASIKEANAEIGRHIRSSNRDYFRDRVRTLSREAFEKLSESVLDGPMFEQTSAANSTAQRELAELSRRYVDEFENRVSYVEEPDPKIGTWHPKPLDTTKPATLAFTRSLHAAYPDAPSFLNNDERPFASALDATGEGWWMRNPPTRALGGFSVPMPVQVKGSNAFFPDFLWWVDNTCYAIDTTGLHILDAKVRGKLLALAMPKIALVTRGELSAELNIESNIGWTLLLPGANGAKRSHHTDLGALLKHLRKG